MSGRKRKSVQEDPIPFKGEFSFVNKDASNIGSKEHNVAVSWHVVNRYEKWKRSEQVKKLKGTPSGPSETSSETSGSAVSTGIAAQYQTLLSKTLQQLDESHTLSYPPEPWRIESAEQSMLRRSRPTTPYLHEQLDLEQYGLSHTARSDELSLSDQLVQSGQYPPLVSRILSFAYRVIVPATWPQADGQQWSYEIARTLEDMSTVTADSCYASATLCFYATLMATATNDADLASQACFFQMQAMSELRQRMSQQTSIGFEAATLKAILRLFSAETALDNTASARVHLKMLRNVISAEGGLIMLDAWSRENILAADCYFALKYETRPLFPTAEWTPGPLSQPWKTRLTTAKIAGDHAPTVDHAVDTVLKSIIMDLRELFRAESYVRTHEVQSDDELLRWCALRKYDCVSRLAEHQLSVKIYPHMHEQPKLQFAVCGAIALMAAMVLGSPEPVRFGTKLVKELKDKFMEVEAEIAEAKEDAVMYENVVLWILYVGQVAERIHPVNPKELWFRRQFATVLGERQLGSKEERDKVLMTFLWSSHLAAEVRGGREYRAVEPKKSVYEACGTSWRKPLDSA